MRDPSPRTPARSLPRARPSRTSRGLCSVRCAPIGFFVGIGTLLALGPWSEARAQERAATSPADSAAVAAAVLRFHDALSTGDSTAIEGLLAPDAVILEGGSVETKADYLGGHLRADMSFAGSAQREQGEIRVSIYGSVARAVSRTLVTRTRGGEETRSATAELMVLRRDGDAWRIVAIHWSSGRAG